MKKKETHWVEPYDQFRLPAILRIASGNHPAGTVIHVTRDATDPERTTDIIFWVATTLQCNWCAPTAVLLQRDFLQRQSADHFWVLVVKPETSMEWFEYVTSATITDPPEHGGVPFHFESEGELRYYAHLHNVDFQKYQIAEFKTWN